MPLSSDQRAMLEAEAQRRGIDPAKLIDAAEKDLAGASGSQPAGGASAKAAKAETPPLYMYHLPFVTVNEVRTVWLGLGAVAGGDQYAADWAAERASAAAPTKRAPTDS
jgi:hypothetical protein